MRPSGRIEVLDYLRGFFIVVIIIDHLWRWPNVFQFISGRGELWVSAAEGFVIISGLLVGYIRGHKNLKKPFGEVSKKLVSRGLLLYAWALVTSLLLVAASWLFNFQGSIAFIPYERFDWAAVIEGMIKLEYTHLLTYFLYLYAIFLVLSPVIIWLLRRGLGWLAAGLSLIGWWIGFSGDVEWLQWQILFFIPAIAGFYLDTIIHQLKRVPRTATWLFITLAAASIAWSAWIVVPTEPGTYLSPLFGREPLTLARIGLAFVWFVAFVWLFQQMLPWLQRWLGWLLLPIGARSLTAYIVHSLPLMLIPFLLPLSSSFWENSLLAIVSVLVTWAIVILPGINRFIPR